jgi:hypothetical protein
MQDQTIITISGIGGVIILEAVALMNGINGTIFITAIGIIGGLAGYGLKGAKEKISHRPF